MQKSGVPACIEINPSIPPRNCLIVFHGLGANAQDLVTLIDLLPISYPIRWVLPDAPIRPVSLCGEAKLQAWYNLYGLAADSQEDRLGLQSAALTVQALIQREIDQGIPAECIMLAGFSQGGALALYAGLRYPQRLGGIIALSSYLPLAQQLAQAAHPANQVTPIFMAQGEQDTIVSMTLSNISLHCLRSLGYEVEFHQYPMAHTLCKQELLDMGQWLKKRIL